MHRQLLQGDLLFQHRLLQRHGLRGVLRVQKRYSVVVVDVVVDVSVVDSVDVVVDVSVVDSVVVDVAVDVDVVDGVDVGVVVVDVMFYSSSSFFFSLFLLQVFFLFFFITNFHLSWKEIKSFKVPINF